MKRRILYIFIFVALLCLAVLFYFYNPASSNFFPPCLFYALTGYQCPGCGTQRAIHSLLHLDIAQAFSFNPFIFIAIPLIIILIALEIFGMRNRFPKLHSFLVGAKFIYILLAAIILFWVLRNIL